MFVRAVAANYQLLVHCVMEQKVNMEFWFKLGKSATETHEMLRNVFGDEAVSARQCFSGSNAFL